MWLRALLAAVTVAGCVPVERVEYRYAPPPALALAAGACAQQQGLTGLVHVRVSIDPDGGAGTISADQGGATFARCTGNALARTRFPRGDRGHTLVVPVVLGG